MSKLEGMRIDVSEVKSFRNCKRQWALSSRNKFNLKTKTPVPALYFGTLFHECLAELYLGAELHKILEMIERELADPAEVRTLEAMVTGYRDIVLDDDLEQYIVKDIEHKFELSIPPFDGLGVVLCGSIDMICLKDIGDNTYEVWGFEHKSCARFRDPMYTAVDEQPRLYTVALQKYVEQLNSYETDAKFVLGGIFINEVRKIQRNFDHKRTKCVYKKEDLDNFMKGFYLSCKGIKECTEEDVHMPDPGQMKCTMCSFKTLCDEYAYTSPDLADILDEFQDEFEVRKVDHLDEKQERNTENT